MAALGAYTSGVPLSARVVPQTRDAMHVPSTLEWASAMAKLQARFELLWMP
jgi:hypothetical protein